jgi:lipopolysaccharide/colanic/teichoic acid biosynthesis glycosyltransferase
VNDNTAREVETPELVWGAESNVHTLHERIPAAEKRVYFALKRVGDIFLSLVGLVVLSPLFLVIAIAIRVDSKGPLIYTQTRIGKKGKPFKIYKFRSMCISADAMLADLQKLNERDGPVFKIKKDPRVTRVGCIIRKTCIDEFPQLVNVFKGDMSLVGPRPPLPNEVEQYTSHQLGRLAITPGLTCYWQVCDRKSASFDDWVEMDLRYIRECAFGIDLKILFKTALVILTGGGAN